MLQLSNPYAPIEQVFLEQVAAKNISLFIKREDLSHPFISGNKWRKLKYHLLAAHAQKANLLVTYGGAYSNHLLATAAAGAKYGFKTHAFVRGQVETNMQLALCKAFGMNLQFVSREEYKQKDALFASYFGSNQLAYQVPEGGAGLHGELGVAESVKDWELSEELKTPTHVFTSVGTGSTMRGLLRGVLENKLATKVHGVVVLKGAEAMAAEFADFSADSFVLHHRFCGSGYAKWDEALLAFIQSFASSTGVLLDVVYEAKLMQGILTLIEEDYFAPGETVLAYHNGGLIGGLSAYQ
ncbi:MAG: 1-aminocyclopropane-1-carboxylate deaminase [Bacteroidetes bacterium B1(2017)]|nr:MAG: 1-aminocyclopropane-1-carboxylate deaminase [Bacteroidetes bacterium B1(2017)]